MLLAWILLYRIYTREDVSMCRFSSPAMKTVSQEDARPVADDSLHPWMQRQEWVVGSVGGSDAGRMFTFTPFYKFASLELTMKKTMPAEQLVWDHSRLEMMPPQPQSAFQPKHPLAMPLPSSMFPIPWAASASCPPCPRGLFTRPVKSPSVMWKLGRKCQKETQAQIPEVTEVWFIVLSEKLPSSGLQLSCHPAPLYLGCCRLPAYKGLLWSMTRTCRKCG